MVLRPNFLLFQQLRGPSHASHAKQDDFKILEDGQPQQIAFFSKEVTLPITLAMLLDTSKTPAGVLSNEFCARAMKRW